MSSSEDDTTRVEAMLGCSLLDCSLLDCDEGWNKVSFPETVSSPEDSTIIVGALPGSSLLECSSSENCGSASETESELSTTNFILRMRKLIMGHVKAVLIHLLIQIINGVYLRMIVKTK